MRNAVCMAIGLATVVSGVPASFAKNSQAVSLGKPAGTASEARERQTHQGPGNKAGISLAVPVGRVSVGPEVGGGQPVYVRRSTVRDGMTIVEVSTTPFMPVLVSNEALPGVRPDQPAGW